MAFLNGWGFGGKKWQQLGFGTPEKRENVSTLRPEQEPTFEQLQAATQGKGAGGAFGNAADYYYGNIGEKPEDYDRFAAPELRNFYENIIPDISEQFAGMGSGALSSSGFRNSAVGAGAGLSERLAALRANVRQNAAIGLTNIGQSGLQNFSQNMVTQQGSQGVWPALAQVAPHAIAAYATGGTSIPASASMLSNQNQGAISSGGQMNNPYAGQGGINNYR